MECEEKQWRGQRIPQTTFPQAPAPQQPNQLQSPESKQTVPDANAHEILIQDSHSTEDSHSDQLSMPLVVENEPAIAVPKSEVSKVPQELEPVTVAAVEVANTPQALGATPLPSSSDVGANAPADALSSNEAALFLSSALRSESWFASNKYVLAALLMVALVIGGIAWLR